MVKHLLKIVVPCCALAGALVACGDEKTVTNVTQESYAPIDVFESGKSLPECGAANVNQQVFVKEDSTLRVCLEGEWQKVSATEYLTDVSCNTVLLQDKSGYKVVCNGDSVGVVQNGSAGAKGENGMGCSLRYDKDADISVIVCGKDSVVVDFPIADLTASKETPEDTSGKTPEPPVDTAEVIPETPVDEDSAIAVSMDSLAGYSQKGPFVKGSAVYLYELQDGKTLRQTNGNFVSRIDSDDGHFKFTARNLASQYVLMQATGYYMNEVTNEKTSEMITLNGITNVLFRRTANINVLTHLEYPRVQHLVTVEKKKFDDAKQQAREEILKAFCMNAADEQEFEDMNVSESELLKDISMLLQGTLTVAQLTERLSVIAADLEKDGIWDNKKMRAEMADWAIEETYDILGGMRLSVNVNAFILDAYGITYEQYDASPYGAIFTVKNEFSQNNGTKFKKNYNIIRPASAMESLLGKSCTQFGDTGIYVGKFWTRVFECSLSDYDGMGWHLLESRPSSSMETMTDPRDNKTYAVVTIGNQTWMAENLNYADSVAYPSLWKKSSCISDYDSTDCHLYGRGYMWSAAMDSVNTGCGNESPCSVTPPVQGVCPNGWHLPDTAEVRELLDYLKNNNPDESVTDMLRSDIGWVNYWIETDGTDKYGFGMLRDGRTFWTSTDKENSTYSFGYDQDGILEYYIDIFLSQKYALKKNVRCIKDKE